MRYNRSRRRSRGRNRRRSSYSRHYYMSRGGIRL